MSVEDASGSGSHWVTLDQGPAAPDDDDSRINVEDHPATSASPPKSKKRLSAAVKEYLTRWHESTGFLTPKQALHAGYYPKVISKVAELDPDLGFDDQRLTNWCLHSRTKNRAKLGPTVRPQPPMKAPTEEEILDQHIAIARPMFPGWSIESLTFVLRLQRNIGVNDVLVRFWAKHIQQPEDEVRRLITYVLALGTGNHSLPASTASAQETRILPSRTASGASTIINNGLPTPPARFEGLPTPAQSPQDPPQNSATAPQSRQRSPTIVTPSRPLKLSQVRPQKIKIEIPKQEPNDYPLPTHNPLTSVGSPRTSSAHTLLGPSAQTGRRFSADQLPFKSIHTPVTAHPYRRVSQPSTSSSTPTFAVPANQSSSTIPVTRLRDGIHKIEVEERSIQMTASQYAQYCSWDRELGGVLSASDEAIRQYQTRPRPPVRDARQFVAQNQFQAGFLETLQNADTRVREQREALQRIATQEPSLGLPVLRARLDKDKATEFNAHVKSGRLQFLGFSPSGTLSGTQTTSFDGQTTRATISQRQSYPSIVRANESR